MPTADTYRIAAADFAALADALADDAGPLDRSLGDDVVVGGRLRPTLDQAIAAIVGGIAASADGYRALADECRRRAAACQAYASALAEYRTAQAAWSTATPEQQATMVRRPMPRRETWMPAG